MSDLLTVREFIRAVSRIPEDSLAELMGAVITLPNDSGDSFTSVAGFMFMPSPEGMILAFFKEAKDMEVWADHIKAAGGKQHVLNLQS